MNPIISNYIVEACTESFLESINAQNNGATRIELCNNLAIGGTTPSYGTIKLCADKLSIPSFVMIRPRGGNFVYSENEINIMLHDINVCKSLGVAGVVFGCLTPDNTLDYNLMNTLCQASVGLEIIMHRAYDELKDGYLEIEKIKRLGIKHILSAGGLTTAFDGKESLAKTYEECQKYGIKLTAAGKITVDNLAGTVATIPADAYHGRAIVPLV
jgi:copper homeostasis protein